MIKRLICFLLGHDWGTFKNVNGSEELYGKCERCGFGKWIKLKSAHVSERG